MMMSYDELLQNMLDKVPSDVDKREGSIIFDAIAPCAYFLAQQSFLMENFINLVFVDTAVEEYLDRAVALYGIERKTASAAIRKIVTSSAVPIGSRWGINNLIYEIRSQISSDVYEAVCETVGEIGNRYSGIMTPVSNVSGVTAELGEIISEGTDTESDEALRNRCYTKIRYPATSGNSYQYRQWALEVPGTGGAKVFPLDHGPGTVTVLVVDDDKVVDASLPEKVAEYIETVRPIGATVTVSSPEMVTINVSANVVLDGSKAISEVRTAFMNDLDLFLKGLVFNSTRVSYGKLGNILLDVPGVEDFDALRVNFGVGNIIIGAKQIPVTGTVVLSEVSAIGID